MPSHSRVSGTWKEHYEAHVRVSGTWRKSEIYLNVSGVWTPILGIVTLTNVSYDRSSTAGPFRCAYRLNLNGLQYGLADTLPTYGTFNQDNAATNWIRHVDLASLFEVRMTQNSGDALDGSSDVLNSWLALTSSRTWGVTAVSNKTTDSANLTVEVRLASTADILDSAAVGISSTND